MSDPFEALRSSAEGATPDVAAIKTRARAIERRRRVVLSSSAALIAAIAITGVLLKTVPGPSEHQLAQSHATPTAAAGGQFESNAAAPAAPSAAASTAQDRAKSVTVTAPSASPTQETRTTAAMGAAPASSDNSGDQLDVTLAVATGPHNAKLTLKACNPHARTVERTFNTGQRYDFEVKRNGTLVWRWSDQRAFTQMVGNESWAPKACKTWTETWNGTNSSGGPAASGSYQAVGILTTSPRQSAAPKTFCLELC